MNELLDTKDRNKEDTLLRQDKYDLYIRGVFEGLLDGFRIAQLALVNLDECQEEMCQKAKKTGEEPMPKLLTYRELLRDFIPRLLHNDKFLQLDNDSFCHLTQDVDKAHFYTAEDTPNIKSFWDKFGTDTKCYLTGDKIDLLAQ